MPRRSDSVRLVPRSAPETKNEKFRRLANQRFRQLKALLNQIGRLSGTGYDSTPEEVEKFLELMREEFSFLERQLRRKSPARPKDDIFQD